MRRLSNFSLLLAVAVITLQGCHRVEGSFQMDIPGTVSDQAAAPSAAAGADLAAAPGLVAGHLLADNGEQLPGYPADPQAAAAPGQVAAAPAGAQGDAKADLLFVQQATMAQLVFDDPDTATDHARLLLHGVSPSTTWFTDKPIRRAGAFETAYFASSDTFDENGIWLGAPNAALTGTHDGQPYVVIVTLYNPTYDNQTHILQYHASLMINETEKNMRLAGGAVSFQANHAVDELGALRYVSSGQDAFTLHNAALFIDDYLGAYPNGICLSSFVSCPSYYGFYRRGWWGGGYGPGFSNYIGIRRLCPKCWEKRRADDSDDEVPPPPQQTPSPSPPPSKDWDKQNDWKKDNNKWSPSPKQEWKSDQSWSPSPNWSPSPSWSPSPKQDWSPSPAWSPSPKQDWSPSPQQQWSPSPSPDHSPSPQQQWSPSPSPAQSQSSPSPPPSTGGAYHCTGCSQGDGKFFCQKCEYW